MKKNKTIIFKVSTEEYQKLEQQWKQSPYAHLSEYIRQSLLNKPTQENVWLEILKTLRIIEERK